MNNEDKIHINSFKFYDRDELEELTKQYYLENQQLLKENEELKKQLEKKYEKVGTLTAEILYEENTRLANEITVLKTENQELKKQLENCYCNRTDCSGRIKDNKQYDSLMQKVESQQKEFIEYLEDMLVSELDIFTVVRVCDVLSKYKEIIGDKDE